MGLWPRTEPSCPAVKEVESDALQIFQTALYYSPWQRNMCNTFTTQPYDAEYSPVPCLQQCNVYGQVCHNKMYLWL